MIVATPSRLLIIFSASRCVAAGSRRPLRKANFAVSKFAFNRLTERIRVGLARGKTELPSLSFRDTSTCLKQILRLLLLHALFDGRSERSASRQADDSDTKQRTSDRPVDDARLPIVSVKPDRKFPPA